MRPPLRSWRLAQSLFCSSLWLSRPRLGIRRVKGLAALRQDRLSTMSAVRRARFSMDRNHEGRKKHCRGTC